MKVLRTSSYRRVVVQNSCSRLVFKADWKCCMYSSQCLERCQDPLEAQANDIVDMGGCLSQLDHFVKSFACFQGLSAGSPLDTQRLGDLRLLLQRLLWRSAATWVLMVACKVQPCDWASMPASGLMMLAVTMAWWTSRRHSCRRQAGSYVVGVPSRPPDHRLCATGSTRSPQGGFSIACQHWTAWRTSGLSMKDKVTIQAPRSDHLFERRLVK